MSLAIRSFIVIGLAGVILACQPQHDERVVNEEFIRQKIGKLLQDPEKISYTDVKEMVLDTSCTHCHSEELREAGVDVSSYENLFGANGFKKSVFAFEPARSPLFNTLIAKGKRLMPPVREPQLIEEQRLLVHTWINQGAKKTPKSVTKRPPTLQEELQPYFDKPESIDHDTIQEKVFQNHCFRCHSEKSAEAEKDVLKYSANLTNYATIFDPFNPVVEKGIPKESSIYRSVAIEQSMPSARDGFQPLDSLLVKLMRLWILNCAIEHYDPGEGDIVDDPDNPDKRRLCDDQ